MGGGRVGYPPFSLPDPHPMDLEYSTRYPGKMRHICPGSGIAGRIQWVGQVGNYGRGISVKKIFFSKSSENQNSLIFKGEKTKTVVVLKIQRISIEPSSFLLFFFISPLFFSAAKQTETHKKKKRAHLKRYHRGKKGA